jgi:hypothetical protein
MKKTKLASSQDAYDSLLNKMEILSIQNDLLYDKLEAIDSSPEAPKTTKFDKKKDASTSCHDLININSLTCK